MALLVGCIADDFTGATDLASMLVRGGVKTIQTIGVPNQALPLGDVQAVVIALKSRTLPAREAVQQSLQALQWLRAQGCEQFYFKYCSTFDSTAQGNIGPVTDALLEALDSRFTIACPAFPENRRCVFNGYLFANDVPLNESGMQDHPLTPMKDANLLRVLQAQTRHNVGLLDYRALHGGVERAQARLQALQRQGVGIAVCDTLDDQDLLTLGSLCSTLPLVTAGSGLAKGLAAAWQASGRLNVSTDAAALRPAQGRRVILSGSCSRATLSQLEQAKARYPALRLDAEALMQRGDVVVAEALDWCRRQDLDATLLIYASSPAHELQRIQMHYGAEQSGARIESALARIAQQLVTTQGFGQLLVAGGETSGAVVEALQIEGLHIGPSIDPGVPWTQALDQRQLPLSLALKSGNFGSDDFMLKAWELLP